MSTKRCPSFLYFRLTGLRSSSFTVGSVSPEKGHLKNCQNVMLRLSFAFTLSILLLAAIGAKLIGPHGGLQVDKSA